jgi:MFS family permease
VTDAHLPLPLAKRAALILAISGALAGSAGAISTGMSGLIGLELLAPDQHGLATAPITAFIVGAALASIPAALLMQRVGRRTGFNFGLLLGAAGSAAAAAAVLMQSFLAFTLTMVALGASGAFIQQYRFAAADAAEPKFKAQAISWVLAAGVISGVIGPQVAINARWLLPVSAMAGPFIILTALMLVAAAIMLLLVVPPPAPVILGGQGRPLHKIVLTPKFLVALLSAVASFSLMSLVMTATPLAMVGHHHSMTNSQLAIQWHVIAMFLPSFVTGNLINRFGKGTVVITGFLLIAAAAGVALMGTGVAEFWISLILLGVGWNFAFIGATAMLTDLYRPEEAFKVQALNEFVLFGVVAFASLSSGGLLASAGWATINIIVLPVVVICVLLIASQRIAERRASAH